MLILLYAGALILAAGLTCEQKTKTQKRWFALNAIPKFAFSVVTSGTVKMSLARRLWKSSLQDGLTKTKTTSHSVPCAGLALKRIQDATTWHVAFAAMSFAGHAVPVQARPTTILALCGAVVSEWWTIKSSQAMEDKWACVSRTVKLPALYFFSLCFGL